MVSQRCRHAPKAVLPNFVNESGSLDMCSNEVHPMKESERISLKLLPNVTEVMPEHHWKASDPMMVTESGITISPVMPWQLRKDRWPMKVNVLGNTTEVISEHS